MFLRFVRNMVPSTERWAETATDVQTDGRLWNVYTIQAFHYCVIKHPLEQMVIGSSFMHARFLSSLMINSV